jgi:hypothetical protein
MYFSARIAQLWTFPRARDALADAANPQATDKGGKKQGERRRWRAMETTVATTRSPPAIGSSFTDKIEEHRPKG